LFRMDSTTETPKSDEVQEYVWKFGFGSNLSPSNLENKKNMKVYEWYPSKLQGWALSFNIVSQRFIEPAYANIVPGDAEKDSVHGSVCRISKKDALVLDQQERSYKNVQVEVSCYDGRKISSEVYVGKETASPAHIFPSKRYLQLIISGAREVKLDPEYIEMLETLPTYTPPKAVLSKRYSVLLPKDLPSWTMSELSEHNGKNPEKPDHLCICGYIIKGTSVFKSLLGRDCTFRKLLHYRGISIDLNDDGGKSPFPKLFELSEMEREYCLQTLDDFMSRGVIVAVLKEFWEEQGEHQSIQIYNKH